MQASRILRRTVSPLDVDMYLELQLDGPGNGDDRGSIGGHSGPGYGCVGGGDAMDLFAGLFLLECHGAEDRSGNHAWSVDKGERAMKTNGAATLGSGYLGREDGVIGGGAIEDGGGATESGMEVKVGLSGLLDGLPIPALGVCHGTGDDGGGHGDGRDQAQALMDLEHVCALVEYGLQLGIGFSLLWSEAKIAERRRRSGLLRLLLIGLILA